ncbi:hypothetical protein EJB05_45282, partial [Eragrostis curvula]
MPRLARVSSPATPAVSSTSCANHRRPILDSPRDISLRSRTRVAHRASSRHRRRSRRDTRRRHLPTPANNSSPLTLSGPRPPPLPLPSPNSAIPRLFTPDLGKSSPPAVGAPPPLAPSPVSPARPRHVQKHHLTFTDPMRASFSVDDPRKATFTVRRPPPSAIVADLSSPVSPRRPRHASELRLVALHPLDLSPFAADARRTPCRSHPCSPSSSPPSSPSPATSVHPRPLEEELEFDFAEGDED